MGKFRPGLDLYNCFRAEDKAGQRDHAFKLQLSPADYRVYLSVVPFLAISLQRRLLKRPDRHWVICLLACAIAATRILVKRVPNRRHVYKKDCFGAKAKPYKCYKESTAAILLLAVSIDQQPFHKDSPGDELVLRLIDPA